jgi:predicted metal-dependent HD superfamily phosphohydrolase
VSEAEQPSLESRAVEVAGLVSRYTQPHRRYHNLNHVDAVLAWVDELAVTEELTAEQRETARLAAWFHDAVYDPAAADNEEQSALLAESTLTEVGASLQAVVEVARLVRLTATHEVEAADAVGAVLCDADLAILAARPDRYDAYSASIRAEYAFVPDDDFRAGRTDVLKRLLDRPSLYATATARDRWELAARANIEQELGALTVD